MDKADDQEAGRAEVWRNDTQAQVIADVLQTCTEQLDLARFFAEHDEARSPYPATALGIALDLKPQAWLQTSLRHAPVLPDRGQAQIVVKGVRLELSDPERALLGAILQRGALRFGQAIEVVPDYTTDDLRVAAAALAQKSLLFIIED